MRAALERGARHVDRAVSGDQNDGQVRIAAANFPQHVEAVAVRQAHIQQQQIERALFQLAPGRTSPVSALVTRSLRLSAEFEAFADFRFVVNNQDGALRHGPLS